MGFYRVLIDRAAESDTPFEGTEAQLRATNSVLLGLASIFLLTLQRENLVFDDDLEILPLHPG